MSVTLVSNGAIEFFNILTDFLLPELLPFQQQTHSSLFILLVSVSFSVHTVYNSVVIHIYVKVCYIFLELSPPSFIHIYVILYIICNIYTFFTLKSLCEISITTPTSHFFITFSWYSLYFPLL